MTVSFVIPTVDVSVLRNPSPSPSDLAPIAAQIRSACTTSGFFQITNHTMDAALVAKAFEYSRKFFSLPLDSKLAAKGQMNGYEPMGANAAAKGTLPDAKESYFVGEEGRSMSDMGIGGNVWPTDPSLPEDFKSTILAYRSQVQALSFKLYSVIALSLDLRADFFDEFLKGDASAARFLHYPPTPQDAGGRQKGIGAHTDYGGLTLLIQDGVGGLQIHPTGSLDDDDAWQDVPPVTVPSGAPPAIVCNIGDFLQLWTNGLYRSTVHRVINLSGKERYSIAYFANGGMDNEVEPIEKCVELTGGKKLFEKVTAKKHIFGRFKQSFADAQKST
ncbi:putative 2OG-Fe(II) oxygenase family oxidoreductase [Gonapodya prolifera JEL478]|uniref:Putative 2OG-Fe(II) oxygenase family oxidoreductase n=1 Tax=Gonapodya prolifera (strain JEL478) TaxID=1344416 RepID=A0A139AAL6_GONPJ|nr:putative 2OG-Fe(II) oxygenase family oxidoreductase [Gonapodya prolifera JEL478]|eukprot:KXS13748.1 putative 2OG-Fe(II) oxygenase family oxidoreductase [Gonapodya prolifera JEL478]